MLHSLVPISSILVSRSQITKICPIFYNHVHRRWKSTNRNELTHSSSDKSSEIDTNVKPFAEKVKETTKTSYYFAIILAGLGVCGTMIYALCNELFSSSSPNNIYSKAVKKCLNNNQISDKLGYPITAYGEETRRGRRQHVSHAFYVDKDGKKHIRMKFHLKGTVHLGTAHLDMVETDSGSYEYRYLFVEVDDMFKSVIVVEDNRNKLYPQPASSGLELQY